MANVTATILDVKPDSHTSHLQKHLTQELFTALTLSREVI